MCTSIISNRNKTIVGFNLDLLDMEYRVSEYEEYVAIEILDAMQGWLPLFGVNNDGGFVGMPTCWPYDDRSDPIKENENNVIMLDIDLLTKKKTFNEVRKFVEDNRVSSLPHITYMSSLSDRYGNVLHIVPGQGYKYYEKPKYKVLTNFSPFKMDSEKHPWMGLDRYIKANELLENSSNDFDVKDCFDVLKEVSQTICPTVVSMVYDASENKVYWCLNRDYNNINEHIF